MRRVIDAQALKKCRDYLATTSTFFGGNPPFKGRGVPKKAHILQAIMRMGCILREEVPRMALRVLRPKSPHSEERARHIEWRDPRGHAAVWL